MIPDSYRSNFRPFYLQPPYALLSFCSLLSPGIGRGIVAPPLRDGFRSWLRHWDRRARQCIWPNRVQHGFVYGLVFRFRLLSTPPLSDAVTFSYGQASVPVRKGLSPFCWCVLSGAPVPGTSCLATIRLSLGDEIHVPSGTRNHPNSSYLRAIQPWAEPSWPFGAKNHPKRLLS